MKNRKKFSITFLLLLLIFFIIYFLLNELKKSPTKPIYLEEKIKKEEFDWQKNLPIAKNLILENFKEIPQDINISLEKLIDIDKDGVDEALINLNYGGAAIENYILMKLKNGEMEIVKFKNQDGSIEGKILNQGVGGGGRYGFDFNFLEDEKIIILESFFAYNSPNDFCKAEAYSYNKERDYFEYNENKSKLFTEKYCQNLCNSINDELKEYFVNICK